MQRFKFVWLSLLLSAAPIIAQEPKDWRPLFNGKNLDGWDTYLGPPGPTVTGLNLKKNAQGAYTEPVGLNNDPKQVFTIVEQDGAPAIRISGEIFGAITSHEEFENYHLKLEQKWGQKKWPPREQAVRDSGLLYHCTGEHGVAHRYWLKSFECQIQEGDTGDFWSVAGVIVDVEGDKPDAKSPLVFRKGGTPNIGYKNRVVRNPRSEKPSGEWNTVEIYVHGQTAVHVSGGKTNMILTNLRHVVGDKEQPLTKGKVQIQSEGAEVFYRNVMIRPIDQIPDNVLLK
jgi:hypothetical protein